MLYADFEKQLDSFSLKVRLECQGDALALLGASGAGKSMTLKCIAGIEKPDRGVITLNGRTLFDSENRIDLPPQKRNVGYLFQDYALFPNMTVLENIKAGLYRKKRAERGEAAVKIARMLQVDHLLSAMPPKLSGGEKQRVALARILASEPEVLLLDEPFSALDSYLSRMLRTELHRLLNHHFQGDIVLVSHNIDDASVLCDNAAVMERGKISEYAPVKTLLSHPKTLAAAKLIGIKNYSGFEKISEDTIRVSDWDINLKVNRIPENASHIAVADSDIILSDRQDENTFAASVEGIFRGHKEEYLIARRGPNTIYVSTDISHDLAGQEVLITIPRDKIIFLI